LLQSQRRVTEFKKSANLVSSEDQTREMVISINTLTREQAQVQAQFLASEAQVKTLSIRLGLSLDRAIRSLRLKENQNYQYIQQRLPEVSAELVKLQVLYTNDHPKVKNLLSERDRLRQQLENYIAQAAAGKAGINTSIGSDSAALIQQLAFFRKPK
jgi:succinoglycan biosynthesis transport protein ExoP